MVELIASFLADEPEDAVSLMRRAAIGGADWIEVRLDRWPAGAALEPVVGATRLPVIATCRMPRDGGSFPGTVEERRILLDRALAAGARGIDLEEWETWTPTPRPNIELVIRSCHARDGVPADLSALRDSLLARGADVAKIVVSVADLADAGPVFDLLASTDQGDAPTVAFAVGETAGPTRVLACMLGARFVYGSIADELATAEGQISLDLLRGLYDVRSLSGATLLFGVLGNPARHSLGPWLHNRVFRWFGADAVYLPFETADPVRLLAALPRRRLRGFSVTAPWKELMARRCHQLDPAAFAVGAVNTVVCAAHGALQGSNTDVAGVRGALLAAGLDLGRVRKTAVVLGSGGAARAAVVCLVEMGFATTVLARNHERIAGFLAERRVATGPLDAAALAAVDPAVVVHATPVGGVACPEPERLVPEWTPAAGTFVLDMVYRPAETRLLRDARAAGAIAIPGTAMFLAQAAEQVERFLGKRPPEALLRRFLAGT